MKRMIKSSKEITNEYLNELFKKIPWEDVDYADRLIDRTIRKELDGSEFGSRVIFNQAELINMLDENVKEDLINRLEHPELLRSKKKIKKSKPVGDPVKLKVIFEPYERYRSAGTRTATVSGPDLLEALKKMVDKMVLYIDSKQIEEDEMTAEEVIDSIQMSNGDGCDFIISLTDLNSGKSYISEDYEEEDWD